MKGTRDPHTTDCLEYSKTHTSQVRSEEILESFSNDDGNDSQNVTINMNSRFSNFIAIIPTRFKCWMLVKFPRVKFVGTAPKFRKRKKNSSSCVYVLHKTSHQEISRPSRAVTAKKCTKKCNARAELLFWLLSLLLLLTFSRVAVALRRC